MYIPSVNDAVQMIARFYKDGDIDSLEEVKTYLESDNVSRYIAGNADGFHNATVRLTRIGFYDYAYALAEVGHNRYPKNTDLLGDLLCYGMHCRNLKDLETWYNDLCQINKRFWTWRAYQFSFDYWMERLPEANEENLEQWESRIVDIFTSFQNNFRFLSDKSDCEKAFLMQYEYYTMMGEELKAESALKEATTNIVTKNKCPQCALNLADHYFAMGNYAESLKYADTAVRIKEDQPSISLGYTNYIRAMSLEYEKRRENDIIRAIDVVYNAYYAALLYLREENGREKLISSVKKQVKMLERETNIESYIPFEEYSSPESDLLHLLKAFKGSSGDDVDV